MGVERAIAAATPPTQSRLILLIQVKSEASHPTANTARRVMFTNYSFIREHLFACQYRGDRRSPLNQDVTYQPSDQAAEIPDPFARPCRSQGELPPPPKLSLDLTQIKKSSCLFFLNASNNMQLTE